MKWKSLDKQVKDTTSGFVCWNQPGVCKTACGKHGKNFPDCQHVPRLKLAKIPVNYPIYKLKKKLFFFAELESVGSCNKFYKMPPGTYWVIAQYAEELEFCVEKCVVQFPRCTAVGTNQTVTSNICLVLATTFACDASLAWVDKPYEIVVP